MIIRYFWFGTCMNSDLILKNIARHITLKESEKSFFLSLLEPKMLKRKELFLQAGTVCKQSAFVVKGALKSYTIDSEGKSHILNFAIQDWWISDLYSLFSGQPAVLNIEAVAESEVLM